MLILNGGMPRSGTVWVFNVIADIVGRLNDAPLAKLHANTTDALDKALDTHQPHRHTLIHHHDITPKMIETANATPGTVCLFNFRDPRDVVVSQMKLQETPFEGALEITIRACNTFMEAFKVDNVFPMPYPLITEAPAAVIHSIALRLGSFIPLNVIRQIEEAHSMARHKKTMEQVQSGQGMVESEFNGIRHVQWDAKSLITDRHIQSGKNNRWKEELDEAQQQKVNEVFGEFVQRFL